MNNKGLYWGLCFVIAGFCVLFGGLIFRLAFGLLDVFLAFILFAIVLRSAKSLNFFGMLIPGVLLFSLLFGRVFDIPTFSLLLCAVLLSIGLELLFRFRKFQGKNVSGSYFSSRQHYHYNYADGPVVTIDPDGTQRRVQ